MEFYKSLTFYGAIAGLIAALIILVAGFKGLLLIVVCVLIGAAAGAQMEGRIDFRALFNTSSRGKG